MNAPETILSPTQRIALIALEDFVHSGNRSAVLLAPRGCGTTTLLRSLIDYRGFGDQPVQFLYRSVATKQSPLDQLSCQVDRLDHRVVFLQDRATDSVSVQRLAKRFGNVQFIQAQATLSTFSSLRNRREASRHVRYDTEIALAALDVDQIRRFVDDHRFTHRGRNVLISQADLETMHRQTGGRLRDLVPLIRARLHPHSGSSKPIYRPHAA